MQVLLMQPERLNAYLANLAYQTHIRKRPSAARSLLQYRAMMAVYCLRARGLLCSCAFGVLDDAARVADD